MDFKSKIFERDEFKGIYEGSGSIVINGKFDGTLIIDEVVINPSGEFFGKIISKSLIVEGKINADVETEIIHIKQNGNVEGDLIYRQIKIDSGGLLKSSKVLKMSDKKSLKRFYAKWFYMEINYENFLKFKIAIGTILSVKDNLKAINPSYILEINFGNEIGIKKSSAQIKNYSKENLINRQIVAVINFPIKRIAGVKSEVLVLGAITDNGVKLLNVEKQTENGSLIRWPKKN